MRANLLTLVLSLTVVVLPSIAAAQATLVSGLGGPLDFGTDFLARGNDSSSPPIDLTPAFPTGIDYFGARYTEIFVNTNGSVSFGAAVPTVTTDELPAASQPTIAAWWADVDTRGLISGEPDRNLVYYALEPDRFVATWIDVGYFDSHVELASAFQIILTPASGEPAGTIDVELRYNRCEWTTGDATPGAIMGLGGIAAQAGLDGGDMVNYVTLPGSRTDAVRELCTTSNVGTPGVWQLHPRGATVTAICGDGLRETGETCDDGGRAPHDGCDADCQIDTPCIQIFDDGAIILPFDALSNLPDANGDDANGGDATGGFMTGGEGGGGGRLDGTGGGLTICGSGGGTDAGVVDMDATVSRDAGSTPFPDVGRFDGSREVDGGPVLNTLSVTGSGCSCRATARTRSGGAPWLALLGLAALLRRRRR